MLYSEMTPAEQATIDADEDRREARKAAFVGADDNRWELRLDYAEWRRKAVSEGFRGDFKAACITVNDGEVPPSPEAWVAAAEGVYWDACADNCYDESEGPGITEPWEVAYGPRGF